MKIKKTIQIEVCGICKETELDKKIPTPEEHRKMMAENKWHTNYRVFGGFEVCDECYPKFQEIIEQLIKDNKNKIYEKLQTGSK